MGLVYLDAWMVDFYAKYIIPTVDGSEILHQLRLVVYLQGFIHPRWLNLGFLNRQQYGSSILRSFPFTIFTFGRWDLRQSFARLMSWFLGATGHPEQQIFAKKSVAQKISSPPENKHDNGKTPLLIGNTSSNGCFSIVMLFFGGCNYSNRKRTPIKAFPFYSEHFRWTFWRIFGYFSKCLFFVEKETMGKSLQDLAEWWIFHHLRSANRIIRLQLCVRLSRLPKGQVLDMWPSKWRQGPWHEWF